MGSDLSLHHYQDKRVSFPTTGWLATMTRLPSFRSNTVIILYLSDRSRTIGPSLVRQGKLQEFGLRILGKSRLYTELGVEPKDLMGVLGRSDSGTLGDIRLRYSRVDLFRPLNGLLDGIELGRPYR